MTAGASKSSALWEQLQRARAKLRQVARGYAAAVRRGDKHAKEDAGESLEQAATVLALAAALYGLHAGAAAPAGAEGERRMAALDPESLVAAEALSAAARPAGDHRWKIVDNWHGGTKVPRVVFVSSKAGDEGYLECERWIHAVRACSVRKALANQRIEILPYEGT